MTSVLAIIAGEIPSTAIDIFLPYSALATQGRLKFRMLLADQVAESDFSDITAVLFYRLCEPSQLKWAKTCNDLNIPYIYQVDDNFLAIDPDTDVGRYHRHPARQWAFVEFIRGASLVRVYSPALRDSLAPYSSRIVLRHTYFDINLISTSNQDLKGEKIRIVYPTSRGSDDHLQLVINEALENLLEKYRDQIEIFFWGPPPISHVLLASPNVHHVPFQSDYRAFLNDFSSANFDIGLAPLRNELFFNSKTNNKYREYGACRIAGVYSSSPLYNSCVKDGENGVLVNNTVDGWVSGIERLILDSDGRRRLADSANKDIRENYSLQAFLDGIIEDYCLLSDVPTISPSVKFHDFSDSMIGLMVDSSALWFDSTYLVSRRLIDLFEAIYPNRLRKIDGRPEFPVLLVSNNRNQILASKAHPGSLIFADRDMYSFLHDINGIHFVDVKKMDFFESFETNYYCHFLYQLYSEGFYPHISTATVYPDFRAKILRAGATFVRVNLNALMFNLRFFWKIFKLVKNYIFKRQYWQGKTFLL